MTELKLNIAVWVMTGHKALSNEKVKIPGAKASGLKEKSMTQTVCWSSR